MADENALLKALESHGEALAVGLGIVASDALDDGALDIRTSAAIFLAPGQTPEECPRRGIIMRHRGTLAPPAQGDFTLGWFLPEPVRAAIEAAAGSPEAALEKINTLANEFGENLATDKFKLTDSAATISEDCWADYLAGELPLQVAWHRFLISGTDHPDWVAYLAWPRIVIDRMFGPPPTGQSTERTDAPSSTPVASPPKSIHSISSNVNRLLRTQVPVIVTLASKMENAGKLLHLGPGSIIEFSQNCDSPLQLSVNNLPIGLGEAVKIGDHFGLKVVEIVPTEERLERLGSKWPY
jgi:flagellar motor switch/type III secretory pathway protein FliN